MIDKAELDEVIVGLQLYGTLTPDALHVLQQFATDYLALRGIVEALATSSPYGASNLDTECEWCGAPRDDEHFDTCTWNHAVALVGSAGEREDGE